MNYEPSINKRLVEAANADPHAKIPWPHRILYEAKWEIESQQTRAEDAESEVEELGNMIAYLRDMFPVPDSGTPLEHEWLSAMGSPQGAVAYVATRIRELHNE